jgi:phosphotriesterase-related protein
MTVSITPLPAVSGQVQTVLGPVAPESLGRTSMHEHLLASLDCYFSVPDEASERSYIERPTTINLLGALPGRWSHHRDSINLIDEQVAVQEAGEWRLEGGGTIVDATSMGIARDPLALARISRATGLNVVMGAGYYVPASHPADMDSITEDEIAERIVGDVSQGVGDTGVRSGIIGEIGCVYPLPENVLRSVRAAGRAQAETGAPILIHPGHKQTAPLEILEILVKAGASPQNVVLGHLDVRIVDRTVLAELAGAGTFLEFDTFGLEESAYGGDPTAIPMPNDAHRLDLLEFLLGLGHRDQIVIAHDVCFRWRLGRFGGKGYGHILANMVPRMRARGFTSDDIDAILVRNPARALAFA